MKCDFCGWKSSMESDTCPECGRKYSDSDKLRKAKENIKNTIRAMALTIFMIICCILDGDDIFLVIFIVGSVIDLLFIIYYIYKYFVEKKNLFAEKEEAIVSEKQGIEVKHERLVEEPTTESANQVYEDLGMPSGTLWATCNVGANAPAQKGAYFAWGETKPIKPNYTLDTFMYGVK